MKITRAVVPSLFTVLNIFCGFLSLIHTARAEYDMATWFIISAAIFDVLDGAMARITKSFSNFGVELDSLSDVVSFGVAPSFLIYRISLSELEGMGTLISAMPMIFGAIRLARFNAQLVSYDKDYFKGLPIPSAAIAVCAYVQQYYREGIGFSDTGQTLFAGVIVVVSLLMISSIKYDAIPKFSRRGIAQHPWRFALAILGVAAIMFTQGRALFPVFVFYLLSGPARALFVMLRQLARPAEKESDRDETEISSVDI